MTDARKFLLAEAAENESANREEYPTLHRFHTDEFNRYFETYDSCFNLKTGEIYGYRSGGQLFIPSEDELKEFAEWFS